jgi:flagella basal body P-ring formation protein FlgA
VIKSISLAGNISDFSKMVLAIVVVIGSVFANIGIASAVTANKLASSSVLKDDVSDKESTSNQYITGKYINEIVTQFLSVKGVEATPNLNPERMFRKCNGTLTVKPMFGNFQTVRVECEDTSGWRIAVRTKAASGDQDMRKTETKTISKMVKKVARNITPKPSKKTETTRVVSLTRSMTRGDIITLDDVTFIDVSMREVVGVFLDQDDVVGRRLKSSVSVNKPVFARQLQPHWMIEKDQEVTLVNHSGAVAVSMLGYAMENGQFGEWIKVKNANSSKIVRGRIINSKKIATGANIW